MTGRTPDGKKRQVDLNWAVTSAYGERPVLSAGRTLKEAPPITYKRGSKIK